MASLTSGSETGKAIIAKTYKKQLILIDIDESYGKLLNGEYLENNNFHNTEMIPEILGLYEIEFKYYWDDGCNLFEEDDDPYWSFKITNVKQIYQIREE